MAQSNRRGTSRRAVYTTLRRKVLTLEFPPGSALSENELAASLGVSRTPVRESLILLSEEGLVQVFPQVGSFVSRVDPAKVADAQFLREAVELASLEDLPAEPAPELVAELRHNLAEQQLVERLVQLEEALQIEAGPLLLRQVVPQLGDQLGGGLRGQILQRGQFDGLP
ncbi:GntR family transcriptional regulator, partial [Streptomyces corynorhini]